MRLAWAELAEAATELDECLSAGPDGFDAGPLTPWVADLMEAVAADCALVSEAMLRLGDQLRMAANNYERTDNENERLLRECLARREWWPELPHPSDHFPGFPRPYDPAEENDPAKEAERRAEEKEELEDEAAEVFDELSTHEQWQRRSGTSEVRP